MLLVLVRETRNERTTAMSDRYTYKGSECEIYSVPVNKSTISGRHFWVTDGGSWYAEGGSFTTSSNARRGFRRFIDGILKAAEQERPQIVIDLEKYISSGALTEEKAALIWTMGSYAYENGGGIELMDKAAEASNEQV